MFVLYKIDNTYMTNGLIPVIVLNVVLFEYFKVTTDFLLSLLMNLNNLYEITYYLDQA